MTNLNKASLKKYKLFIVMLLASKLTNGVL